MFSLSCAASVGMFFYMAMAILNLYMLMYPLALVDLQNFPSSSLVGPLWKKEESSKSSKQSRLGLKVYLSSREQFKLDFLKYEYPEETKQEGETPAAIPDSVLLWEQPVTSASLTRSILLTTEVGSESSTQECKSSQSCNRREKEMEASYAFAKKWLDEADQTEAEGGLLNALSSAGGGIESTSVLLTVYQSISKTIGQLFSSSKEKQKDKDETMSSEQLVVPLPESSPLWSALKHKSTLYTHVVLLQETPRVKPLTYMEAAESLRRQAHSHSVLLGAVDLVKFAAPDHVRPPRRVLYHDLVYILKRYVLRIWPETTPPVWDMSHAKPEEYKTYHRSLEMKREGKSYPYWKPEVAIKYVYDDVQYPDTFIGSSGMEVVRTRNVASHPSGFAYLPALHVDEIGLTSEKYIPINETVYSLPLRITFDRNDIEAAATKIRHTGTAGGMSPARWRLLSQLSESLESQKSLGFEDSEIDDLRRLIGDTDVVLLAITILASALHLLFEFLTFKNEVSFWSSNKDLTGLSVRSLFLDFMGQVIILLYLIEKDSSLLMTVPSGIGCAIALWKCQRGAGFKFLPIDRSSKGPVSWWNVVPRMVGYELRATRLEIAKADKSGTEDGKNKGEKKSPLDLAALSIETDRIATRTLGTMLLPVVLTYTVYSLIREEHTGWYSWLITSASSAVYALGFVLMTPQLFLNYKLKSVAHLPWRVLVYRFLNTFIDDLFAFIIRMPTMARISCFRDDIVFFIYLYQRWLYPVDTSRPVEGGNVSTGDQQSEKKKKE